MQTDKDDWRNQEFKYDQFFFQITFGLLAIVLAVMIGFALFPDDMGYRSNLYTTAVGVLVTVSVLDLLNRRREEKRYKSQLIREMKNLSNGISERAVSELRANKWGFYDDNSLAKAYLHGSNLRHINLYGVILTSANLGFAKLQRASLEDSNLHDADLRYAQLTGAFTTDANFQNTKLARADLRGAFMVRTDLRSADLFFANLENAIMWGADLRGASLKGANLQGVEFVDGDFPHELQEAKFDETTILPDRTYWTQNTDMGRFTNPKHPNFWKATGVYIF